LVMQPGRSVASPRVMCWPRQRAGCGEPPWWTCRRAPRVVVFFLSSRRRHTRSVSAFLLNRSSDLMQRYHDVISSFGGKTSYDADNRPLLVMRSNLWASGYDVDGTDQTSLGQFSGRVQQTYKHSVPRFFVPEHGT